MQDGPLLFSLEYQQPDLSTHAIMRRSRFMSSSSRSLHQRMSARALAVSIIGAATVVTACAAPPREEGRAAGGSTLSVAAATGGGAAGGNTAAGTVAAGNAAGADATGSASGAPAAASSAGVATVADTTTVTVYKSPTCGCCTKWVHHLEEHGMRVVSRDVDDVSPMKRQLGVPEHLGSCHTAVVGGYVVEGHVPADIIKRMLRERPQIAGIAVAGMPLGSPGMETGNGQREPYSVMAIGRDGRTSVYANR